MRENERADARAIPIFIGTMGWGYADWCGPFYPPNTVGRDQIRLYAQCFNAVEIDSTFYAPPKPQVVEGWYRATPEHFLFCPKVPKQITHELHLAPSSHNLIREFVATMKLLGEKLGPILFQMPPDFRRSELPNLEGTLPLLDEITSTQEVRFAIEFRHRSLEGEDVAALLRQHRVALAAVDYIILSPKIEITADFLYVRLIGRHGAFAHHDKIQHDKSERIQKWVEAIKRAAGEVEKIFIFCNNDYEGFSPATCNRVLRLLGQEEATFPVERQQSLFG